MFTMLVLLPSPGSARIETRARATVSAARPNGRATPTRAPPPGRFPAGVLPSYPSAIAFTMASPSPVPELFDQAGSMIAVSGA